MQDTTFTPSAYQQAIFDDVEGGTGHTVVIARAGSGKTTTIVRALERVPAGCSTLFVAFNKSIASELERRVPAGVTVRTLHAFGLATITASLGRPTTDARKTDMILRAGIRESIERAARPLPPNVTAARRAAWEEDIDARVRAEEKRTREERQELAKAASLAKATLVQSKDELRDLVERRGFDVPLLRMDEFVAKLARLLDDAAAMTSVVDFDDMIWLPVRLGLRVRRFDRVFIDETQDLNRAQIELALRACAPGGRICAVGDDRQAIYAFRGADACAVPNVIARLRARELPLSVTYRCPRAVVDLAREIVPDLESAPAAARGEVAEVDGAALRAGAAPGDFVLSRTRAPLIGLCLGFLRAGMPASVAGRDVGAELAARVKRCDARTVPEMLADVRAWRDEQVYRLSMLEPPGDTEAIEDTAACIVALAEGARTVAEVLLRIETLFADGDDARRIVCSTTHKAKGLERDRVWVLADTYRKREAVEEENLWYVAITRARSALFIVREKRTSGGAP